MTLLQKLIQKRGVSTTVKLENKDDDGNTILPIIKIVLNTTKYGDSSKSCVKTILTLMKRIIDDDEFLRNRFNSGESKIKVNIDLEDHVLREFKNILE